MKQLKLIIFINFLLVSNFIIAQNSEINNMKFEKLKRLYKLVNEFECEVILEIQNVSVPCKFKNYEDTDELIERLEKGKLKNDLILFESGLIGVGKYVLIDSQGSIYLSSSLYGTKKTIIAKNLDEFFSKFKISFQYLPTVDEILKKKRYVNLYLDERYEVYDLTKLIEKAANEATSRIKVKHITESKNNELENFIEITNNEVTEKMKVAFNISLNSVSFTEYLDRELNPFLKDKMKSDFRFAIIHENIWDNRAKVVFVNSEEYEGLKNANLIMDEVSLMIN